MDCGDMFYAERIGDLRENRKYHMPRDDFKRIYEYFPKIVSEELDTYRTMAHKLLEATSTRHDDEEETFHQNHEKSM